MAKEIDKFLDKAVLKGFKHVEVIHGKGEGVLRKELHTYLQTYPLVETYSAAPADRGGDGVTLVELR